MIGMLKTSKNTEARDVVETETLPHVAASLQTTNQKLCTALHESKIPPLTPRTELAPEFWFAYDESEELSLDLNAAELGLHLHLKERGQTAWITLSYALPMSELQEVRYIGVFVSGHSKGMALMRPCVRYVRQEGYTDQFADTPLVSPDGEYEHIFLFRVDKMLLQGSLATEMLFFVEGTRCDFTLTAIENFIV